MTRLMSVVCKGGEECDGGEGEGRKRGRIGMCLVGGMGGLVKCMFTCLGWEG